MLGLLVPFVESRRCGYKFLQVSACSHSWYSVLGRTLYFILHLPSQCFAGCVPDMCSWTFVGSGLTTKQNKTCHKCKASCFFLVQPHQLAISAPMINDSGMAMASHGSPSHPPALFFARGQTQSIFGLSAVLGWCSVMSCFTVTVHRTVFVVIPIKMGPV